MLPKRTVRGRGIRRSVEREVPSQIIQPQIPPPVAASQCERVVKAFPDGSMTSAHQDDDNFQAPLNKGPAEQHEQLCQLSQAAAKKDRPQPLNPEELDIMHKLSLDKYFPRRPGVGKFGRKIKLFCNNFPITIPRGCIYHYDVEIACRGRPTETSAGTKMAPPPEKKFRRMSYRRNREVVNEMVRQNESLRDFYPAYDGRKNLYTRKPVQFSSRDMKFLVVMHDDDDAAPVEGKAGRQEVYEVTIQPADRKGSGTCAISLDPLHDLFDGKATSVPQDIVMAMETILRSGPCLRFTPIGRCLFHPPAPGELHPLGGGKELWFGHHQSVRLGQFKPLVNINVTAAPFHEPVEVIKHVCDALGISRNSLRSLPQLREQEIARLSKDLRNLWIEVTHLAYRRKHKVLRLTHESAKHIEFSTTTDGHTVTKTIAGYFRERYKELEFPQLPCLQVYPEAKKIFLPLEVCKIKEGQHCRLLDESQRAEMMKYAAIEPAKRFRNIRRILMEDLNFNADPQVQEFGFEVAGEPLELEGRVLNAPNVSYERDQRKRPEDGKWNMTGVRYLRGATVRSWVLVSFSKSCGKHQLRTFANLLIEIGRERGIHIDFPSSIEISDSRERVHDVLQRLKAESNPDLAVVVIPLRNRTLYHEVKRAAENDLRLATQCVKDDSVNRCCNPGNRTVLDNLCQKINAKMGGVNCRLARGELPDPFRKPFMVIGADVSHPSPPEPPDTYPAVAAAVGSLDAYPSRYTATCRAQSHSDSKKSTIEIMVDLEGMVSDLLMAFYRKNGHRRPEMILFFRDGVSEGQFRAARDHEVGCVRRACRSLGGPHYEPGVTFVVVQKRHHTRFAVRDRRDGRGGAGNVPPGTTVDTVVSHPIHFDFFLCSHYGLKGTSKPGHYVVLEDDNKFTADELQQLTYSLCHTSARCLQSISVPVPVDHAHRAAARARKHMLAQWDKIVAKDDDSAATYATDAEAVAGYMRDLNVNVMCDNMYYV